MKTKEIERGGGEEIGSMSEEKIKTPPYFSPQKSLVILRITINKSIKGK